MFPVVERRFGDEMGSYIHLSLGRLEIDWGKNWGFSDHSSLFQTTDVTKVPYYYADNKVVRQNGLSKPLRHVLDRAALLGHTLKTARQEFSLLAHINSFDESDFPFDVLAKALGHVDVSKVSIDYGEGDDFGKFVRREIVPRLGLEGVPYFGSEALENLSAESILLLLGANAVNLDLPVNWQYADLVSGGWGKRHHFVKPLQPDARFLIVTEGSSDTKIISHAFKLLMPHVADFFTFVDMQEGYPFTGTGNLFRFTQGLIGIEVLNQIIILYDNDAEGVSSYRRTKRLSLPPNMVVKKLPDLQEFKHFWTQGPSGRRRSNINGRAASIECYLDTGDKSAVRWTSYNNVSRRYQGELADKGAHVRKFLSRRNLEGYDTSKIRKVLHAIIQMCVAMRERLMMDELRRSISPYG
jgi:hypothetical protein